jgi:hypothetical protein
MGKKQKQLWRPYHGGYLHIKSQLQERFGEDITEFDYIKLYVDIGQFDVPKQRNQRFEKRVDFEKGRIYVYAITKRWKYAITVYKIDDRNKKRTKKFIPYQKQER